MAVNSDGRVFVDLRKWCRTKLIGLFLVIWIVGRADGAQPKSTGCSTPIWSTDAVQNLGPNRTAPFLADRDRAGVTFLDDKQLIVYEVGLDTGQLSSRQSAEVSSPFQLHASVLNANSGTSILARDWGTRVRDSSILVTSGGILVRTGETLRLLSKDFVELQKVPLPHPDPGEEWQVRVSASRRTVLVNYYNQDWKRKLNFSRFYVLEGNTFDVKKTWTESPALHTDLYSVSDSRMARDDDLHKPERVLWTQFGTQRWEPVWEKPKSCVSPAILIVLADDSFVYGCKELSFVSGGQVLMRDRFDRGETLVQQKTAVTPDGRLVAISLQRIKGGFFDTERHTAAVQVAVYDLTLKKRILAVDVDPLPKNDYDFALSPDGSKLAILNDRKVSVCGVPVQSTEHTDTLNQKDGTLHLQVPIPASKPKQ